MLRFSRLIGGGFLIIVLLAFVGRVVGLPVGRGVVNVPLGPESKPIELVFWYSTEKQEWLKTAIERFEAGNPTVGGRPITVSLVGLGSGEIVQRVATQDWRGDPPPAVVSPASTLQIVLLKQKQVALAGDAPQPLVITPLVLVAWQERAKALWPNGPQPQSFWRDLHDALVDPGGWQAHGGQTQWGLVKFGHTSPLTSNSGTQTLLLLAYSFANKTNGLSAADAKNPEFQTWLREIEAAVPEFGDSTGTFMASMAQFGPGKYDFGTAYENTALEQAAAAERNWGQKFQIYYPPATLLSDHPFAILAGSWVAPEQQEAARQLRSFLLSSPIQELALESGFRPANPNVDIRTNNQSNPFLNSQATGVKTDLGSQAELPPADVVCQLLDIWQTTTSRGGINPCK